MNTTDYIIGNVVTLLIMIIAMAVVRLISDKIDNYKRKQRSELRDILEEMQEHKFEVFNRISETEDRLNTRIDLIKVYLNIK